MKRYEEVVSSEEYTGDPCVKMIRHDNGQWVPAEVAQALYDALRKADLWTDEEYDVGEWRDQASAALSLADGE
jgi:hypothetical protein